MSFHPRPVLFRLASNTAWLFLERGISLAAAVGVGFYFVRYLGPESYGLYGYALGLYGLFAAPSKLGINGLAVSETVEFKSRQASILGSVFALRMAASLACMALVNAVSYGLADPPTTRRIILVLSVALLFGPFETITHWFEANVNMKPVAIARSVSTVLVALARLSLIATGSGLIWFVWLVSLEGALTAVFFLVAYGNSGLRASQWRIDFSLVKRLIRDGSPLLLSAVAAVIYMKIDVVMLARMGPVREVGLYSAAVRISEMFYFIPVVLVAVLFPYLIKFSKRGTPLFQQFFQLICDGFAWVAILIALLTTLFSEQIIRKAFGEEYLQSAGILVVHVWAGVFIFLEVLRSRWMVIQKITRFQPLTTIAGAVLNVLLNLYLIPRYQGYGAAIATTVSYGFTVVFACFLARETRTVGVILLKAMVAPLRVMESARTFALVRASVDGK